MVIRGFLWQCSCYHLLCQLAGLWSVVIRGLPVAVFVLPPAVSVGGAYGQWSLGGFLWQCSCYRLLCQLAGLWSVVIRGLPVAVFMLPPAVSVGGPIVSGH